MESCNKKTSTDTFPRIRLSWSCKQGEVVNNLQKMIRNKFDEFNISLVNIGDDITTLMEQDKFDELEFNKVHEKFNSFLNCLQELYIFIEEMNDQLMAYREVKNKKENNFTSSSNNDNMENKKEEIANEK